MDDNTQRNVSRLIGKYTKSYDKIFWKIPDFFLF